MVWRHALQQAVVFGVLSLPKDNAIIKKHPVKNNRRILEKTEVTSFAGNRRQKERQIDGKKTNFRQKTRIFPQKKTA